MAEIQLKHFFLRAVGDQAAEEALNRFLRGHQVLEVRQEFVANGTNSAWYIAVRYAQVREETGRSTSSGRPSVDYKDILEPEAFARFVEMRERRKAISEAEGLPAFAVFTDKELAGIAELENPQLRDLTSVKGIGEKKAERFGPRILNRTVEQDNEASGPAV